MFVEFGGAEAPVMGEGVCLRQAFHLEADDTYRVHHPALSPEEQILILTTSGSGFFRCGDFSAAFSPGDSMLLRPGMLTFQYYTLGESWSFWWFEFSGGGREPWKETRRLRWDNLMSLLCSACLNTLRQGHPREASELLGGLLAQVHLRCGGQRRAAYREELFFQARQLIQRELGSITVGEAAEQIGVSPRTLRDLFLEFAGCPPKQYILREKLDTACYLLANTSKTIGEIGELLGFSSQFHFSRTFRENKGVPPGVWRSEEG